VVVALKRQEQFEQFFVKMMQNVVKHPIMMDSIYL
jgi:hypothetical protein